MDAPESERARRRSQVGVKVISFDEMWTYAGARLKENRNDLWVWTAVMEERDGRRWIDIEAVGRDEASFMRLLKWLLDAECYETDAYPMYCALPVNKHAAGKYGAVNRNEGSAQYCIAS